MWKEWSVTWGSPQRCSDCRIRLGSNSSKRRRYCPKAKPIMTTFPTNMGSMSLEIWPSRKTGTSSQTVYNFSVWVTVSRTSWEVALKAAPGITTLSKSQRVHSCLKKQSFSRTLSKIMCTGLRLRMPSTLKNSIPKLNCFFWAAKSTEKSSSSDCMFLKHLKNKSLTVF